jgi:thiol reductant ABC exporter CydD subunit
MRGVEARLWHDGRATRVYFVELVLAGALSAALLVAQAGLLATVIARVADHRSTPSGIQKLAVALAVVVACRALIAWFTESAGHRASASVKSQLRCALVRRGVHLGCDGLTTERTGDVATLATTGVDALDGYYARYLPQLVLAAIVPAMLLVVIARADWLSAVLLVITLPLIPVFMVLIGATTKQKTQERLRALQVLSGHFLDVVSGLTTLKVFNRSKAQSDTIAEITDEYRKTTIATLRIAFLSSLVLELVASVAVALVAVSIGLRLLDGHVGLATAFFVLILAPEVFLPLRQVGTQFHASADGVGAAQGAYRILDQPMTPRGEASLTVDPSRAPIVVDDLTVRLAERERPAIDHVSFTIEPGRILAITGPSGSGKSTILRALAALVPPTGGSIRVGDVELRDVDPDSWRASIAWLPQRPHIFAATVADNVRIGRTGASNEDVRDALGAAGLADVVAALPEGMHTFLGDRGAGLSAGERQRLALARVFLRDAPLLLLDEPTAALDGETEADLLETLWEFGFGRTVVVAAHRPALVAFAHDVLSLGPVGVGA